MYVLKPRTSRGHAINSVVLFLKAYSQERQKAYNLLTMEYVVACEGGTAKDTSSAKKRPKDKGSTVWLQGDLDMYTPANQKKRKRLKESPAIQVSRVYAHKTTCPGVWG